MEEQFFKYENCDYCGGSAFNFGNAELTRDVGRFKTGSKFCAVCIDFEDGEMLFFNEGNESGVADARFKLSFAEPVEIKDEVPSPESTN